jgi:hypothetical protein
MGVKAVPLKKAMLVVEAIPGIKFREIQRNGEDAGSGSGIVLECRWDLVPGSPRGRGLHHHGRCMHEG